MAKFLTNNAKVLILLKNKNKSFEKIANENNISFSGLKKIVKKLENEGYIKRIKHGRKTKIRFTSKARKIYPHLILIEKSI